MNVAGADWSLPDTAQWRCRIESFGRESSSTARGRWPRAIPLRVQPTVRLNPSLVLRLPTIHFGYSVVSSLVQGLSIQTRRRAGCSLQHPPGHACLTRWHLSCHGEKDVCRTQVVAESPAEPWTPYLVSSPACSHIISTRVTHGQRLLRAIVWFNYSNGRGTSHRRRKQPWRMKIVSIGRLSLAKWRRNSGQAVSKA